MTPEEPWKRFTACCYTNPDLGLALDYSRMKFDDVYLGRMETSIQDAYKAMAELERGAVANPDENRMVGHYWLRAPELAPSDALRGQIVKAIDDVKAFAARVHGGALKGGKGRPFANYLLIGIGGSALGPQLTADALGSDADKLKPHFLDNTDPDGIQRALTGLKDELDATLAVVISKSGGTPETRNGMLAAKRFYEAQGLDFGKHAVAVTSDGSKLFETAQGEGWLATFPMWDWVGGRTSITSAVGLLPMALQGLDIDGVLAGAAAMDRATRETDTARNPAGLLALMWYHAGNGVGAKDMVILPYKDRLALFSKYLQQLVMESLGKEKDLFGNVVNQGIAVYGNKGSTDQHAYVQQLREGLPNFFATFIEVQRADAGSGAQPLDVEDGATLEDFLAGFYLGTREALHENGRESLTITIRKLDARALGMLIALYERAVGLYATLVNVNAYHQPGVEAGKKAAASILDLQGALLLAMRRRATAHTAEEWAEEIGATDRVETIFKTLDRLAENPERGIERIAGPTAFAAKFKAR